MKVEILSRGAGGRGGAPGARVPDTGSIEFGGIRIESDPSQAPLPDVEAPKPPEKVTDLQVLFMESGGKLIALPELADSAEFQKIQVPVGELAGVARRPRPAQPQHPPADHRSRTSPSSTRRSGATTCPTKALSEAGDAVLEMDGIEVSRPTNVIDDLMPGRHPHPEGAQRRTPVELTVHRDVENIKNRSSRSSAPTTGSSRTSTCSPARTRRSSIRPATSPTRRRRRPRESSASCSATSPCSS